MTTLREPIEAVPHWLLGIRQDREWTPPEARFSIDPGVAAVLGRGRLKTERQLLEAVLAFCYRNSNARDEEPDPARNAMLERLRLPPTQPESEDAKGKWLQHIAEFEALPGSDTKVETARAEEIESAQALRREYFALFAQVAADPKGAAKRFLPTEQLILTTQVWALPEFDSKTGEMYPHLVLNNTSALRAFVAVLLLTPRWEFGESFHRCSKCRRFFLEPIADGRRQRVKYCSEDCERSAHDAGSAARQRRSRAVQKIAKDKPRFGKVRASEAVMRAFERSPNASVADLVESALAELTQAPRKHK